MATCATDSMDGLVLVFERIYFGSLYNYLHEKNQPPPAPHAIVEAGMQMCEGLIYIHQNNYLHNSISSHAIFLTNCNTLKIGNLEYMLPMTVGAKSVKPPTVSSNKYLNAAYNWMPPEVMKGEHTTEKSDIYSLCTVIWELYTGFIPWAGHDADQIQRQVCNQKMLKVNDSQVPSKMSEVLTYGLQPSMNNRKISLEQIRDIIALMPRGRPPKESTSPAAAQQNNHCSERLYYETADSSTGSPSMNMIHCKKTKTKGHTMLPHKHKCLWRYQSRCRSKEWHQDLRCNHQTQTPIKDSTPYYESRNVDARRKNRKFHTKENTICKIPFKPVAAPPSRKNLNQMVLPLSSTKLLPESCDTSLIRLQTDEDSVTPASTVTDRKLEIAQQRAPLHEELKRLCAEVNAEMKEEESGVAASAVPSAKSSALSETDDVAGDKHQSKMDDEKFGSLDLTELDPVTTVDTLLAENTTIPKDLDATKHEISSQLFSPTVLAGRNSTENICLPSTRKVIRNTPITSTKRQRDKKTTLTATRSDPMYNAASPPPHPPLPTSSASHLVGCRRRKSVSLTELNHSQLATRNETLLGSPRNVPSTELKTSQSSASLTAPSWYDSEALKPASHGILGRIAKAASKGSLNHIQLTCAKPYGSSGRLGGDSPSASSYIVQTSWKPRETPPITARSLPSTSVTCHELNFGGPDFSSCSSISTPTGAPKGNGYKLYQIIKAASAKPSAKLYTDTDKVPATDLDTDSCVTSCNTDSRHTVKSPSSSTCSSVASVNQSISSSRKLFPKDTKMLQSSIAYSPVMSDTPDTHIAMDKQLKEGMCKQLTAKTPIAQPTISLQRSRLCPPVPPPKPQKKLIPMHDKVSEKVYNGKRMDGSEAQATHDKEVTSHILRECFMPVKKSSTKSFQQKLKVFEGKCKTAPARTKATLVSSAALLCSGITEKSKVWEVAKCDSLSEPKTSCRSSSEPVRRLTSSLQHSPASQSGKMEAPSRDKQQGKTNPNSTNAYQSLSSEINSEGKQQVSSQQHGKERSQICATYSNDPASSTRSDDGISLLKSVAEKINIFQSKATAHDVQQQLLSDRHTRKLGLGGIANCSMISIDLSSRKAFDDQICTAEVILEEKDESESSGSNLFDELEVCSTVAQTDQAMQSRGLSSTDGDISASGVSSRLSEALSYDISGDLEESCERPRIDSYPTSEVNLHLFEDESCLMSPKSLEQSNISQNELDKLNKLISNCELQLSLADHAADKLQQAINDSNVSLISHQPATAEVIGTLLSESLASECNEKAKDLSHSGGLTPPADGYRTPATVGRVAAQNDFLDLVARAYIQGSNAVAAYQVSSSSIDSQTAICPLLGEGKMYEAEKRPPSVENTCFLPGITLDDASDSSDVMDSACDVNIARYFTPGSSPRDEDENGSQVDAHPGTYFTPSSSPRDTEEPTHRSVETAVKVQENLFPDPNKINKTTEGKLPPQFDEDAELEITKYRIFCVERRRDAGSDDDIELEREIEITEKRSKSRFSRDSKRTMVLNGEAIISGYDEDSTDVIVNDKSGQPAYMLKVNRNEKVTRCEGGLELVNIKHKVWTEDRKCRPVTTPAGEQDLRAKGEKHDVAAQLDDQELSACYKNTDQLENSTSTVSRRVLIEKTRSKSSHGIEGDYCQDELFARCDRYYDFESLNTSSRAGEDTEHAELHRVPSSMEQMDHVRLKENGGWVVTEAILESCDLDASEGDSCDIKFMEHHGSRASVHQEHHNSLPADEPVIDINNNEIEMPVYAGQEKTILVSTHAF